MREGERRREEGGRERGGREGGRGKGEVKNLVYIMRGKEVCEPQTIHALPAHTTILFLPLQVIYQNILKLSYIDKLLDQVQLAFRDRYKNELAIGPYCKMNFSEEFKVRIACSWYMCTPTVEGACLPQYISPSTEGGYYWGLTLE